MNPVIPENYIISNVARDVDSFFNSVAQGLTQVKRRTFSEKMLRQECKKYAENCGTLHTTIGDQNIEEYIAQIQYGTDECQNPIRGRPEVEGQIICKHLMIRMYIMRKQVSGNSNISLPDGHNRELWSNRMVDTTGYRRVEHVDYECDETIYIIQEDLNFKPILKNIPKASFDNNESRCADIEQLQNSEINGSQTKTYNKRKGAAGAGGHFYEIKLLTLFFLRLQETDKFYLASNLENAGAFDDVVFRYEITDEKGIKMSKITFLQAKYRDKQEAGRITIDNLLSPKGAFSLQKYFDSFQEIKRNFKSTNNPIFNGKFEDCNFIIFTNYELFSTHTNDRRWMNKAADGILLPEGKQSKRLNVDADINQDIIANLSCSPLQKLVKEIYDYTLGNKKRHCMTLENEIFKEYHIFLANNVFTVNSGDPRKSNFKNDVHKVGSFGPELFRIANSSEEDFEKILKQAKVKLCPNFGNHELKLEQQSFDNLVMELANLIAQSESNIIQIDNPSEDIKKLANNVLVKDDLSHDASELVKFRCMDLTGQAKEFMGTLQTKLVKTSLQNEFGLKDIRLQIKGFPKFTLPALDTNITEDEIKQFLRKLDFVFDQDKEDALDGVIKEKIRTAYGAIDKECDAIFESVRTQVEKWWKSDNHFLTKETKFVENARTSISHFQLSALDKLSKRGIEITGVQFNETALKDLKTVNDQKQILNIVAERGTTLLSSVKVCQTLGQNAGDNSYIFVQLNYLLYIQDHALQIFQADNIKHFMVIENNSGYEQEFKWSEEDFQKLYAKLHKIIMKDKIKKVVLITEDDTSTNYFIHDTECFCKVHDNITLNHLTIPTQEKLMDKKVTLHGKSIKMRDLVDIRNENAKTAITSQTIMSLIKNDNLMICNAPQRLSDLEAAYTKLYEKMPMENLVRELRSSLQTNTIFVISGIKKPRGGTLHEELINLLQITDPYLERHLRQRICLHNERNGNKTVIIIESTNKADPLIEFRHICSNKVDNIIYWLEITDEHVQLQQVYEPNFYIKRNFDYAEKTVLNPKVILQKNPSALFIFNDAADRQKIDKLISNLDADHKKSFQDNCEHKRIRFAISESHDVKNKNLVFESDSLTETHMDMMKGTTVHWLQMLGSPNENEQLVWKKSSGSFEQLRSYIDAQNSKRNCYTEVEFSKYINDKVVIIADEPGMGKTTSLTSISQQMLEENWVIRINLLDCKEGMKTLPVANLNFEDVYNFVSKVESTGLNNYLAKQLMLYTLNPGENHCCPILIMFDGYDEISNERQRNIIPLLQFIKWQTSAKLWVTTRLSMIDGLENSLSAFATKFRPLVLEEQKEFLNRFWRVRLGPLVKQENVDKIALYSSKLLDESADILGKTISQVLGVPLQLRLLAEGLMREIVNYLNGCDDQHPKFDHLNLLKLYQKFIDDKYEIYIREKIRIGNIPPSIRQILVSGFDEHHEKSALHLLFPKNNSLSYLKGVGNIENDDMIPVGLIQSLGWEGKPYFIHQTFAEYFAAKYLAGCLKEKKINPKKYIRATRFLIIHIFQERNNVIREFLDQMLSEGSPIHIATLSNKLREVIEITKVVTQSRIVDNLDRTALHLAARDGHLNIVKVLLDNGYDVASSDALGKTSLHYATMNSHREVIEYLLNYTADIDIGDTVFARPLHVDMEIGDNLFRDEYSTSLLVTFVNQKDIEGVTAMNKATENNDCRIACTLISYGANISFRSEKHKKKLLTYLVKNTDYFHILGLFLISYPVEVYSDNRNHNWDEILGRFISLGHTKVIQAMLENKTSTVCLEISKSLTWNYEYGDICSDEDNLKVAKYLFEKCNNDTLIRNLGVNAARHGNLETLKCILEQEKKYDLHDYKSEAIKWGQQNIVMYLFQKYTTPDELNTALCTAVKYNRLGIVKYLVENGADVDAHYEGKTLLQYAVSTHSTSVMLYLKKQGVGSTISGKLGHSIEGYVEMRLTYYKYKSMEYDVMNNLCHLAEVCPHVYGLSDSEKVADIIISEVHNEVNCGNEHGTTLLHIAASFPRKSFANYLIEHGADVNIKDREGRTPLHKAVQAYCHKGLNNETVIYLLACGAVYDEHDANNATVFDYFSQSESQTNSDHVFKILNMINMLFKNRIENFKDIVNPKLPFLEMRAIHGAKNSGGNTPLHVFAECGNVEIVSIFIKRGCPFNSRNNENYTPKDLAQKMGHNYVVEIIQSVENAYIAIRDNNKLGNQRICKEFTNARDADGKTMLHWAAANGNVFIAKLLITNRVVIDKKNNRGWTALHYAANHDKLEITELLLYHGAEFNPINWDRKSPLQVATGKSLNFLEQVNEMYNAIRIESPEIANECLKSMQSNNYKAFVAAINCTDNYKNPLLSYVTAANDSELVKLLLQNGAIYDKFSNNWINCGREIGILLHPIPHLLTWERQPIYRQYAIDNAPTKLELIQNFRDKRGNTILHTAAAYPVNYYRLKFLIKHDADVNAINKKGQSVLDVAIRNMNLDLVKFLLKNNVNVKKLAPDYKQKLIEQAESQERPDIIDLIKSLEKSLK